MLLAPVCHPKSLRDPIPLVDQVERCNDWLRGKLDGIRVVKVVKDTTSTDPNFALVQLPGAISITGCMSLDFKIVLVNQRHPFITAVPEVIIMS